MTQKQRSLSKAAVLAGAALSVPAVSYAGSCTLNTTYTSSGSDVSCGIDLNNDGITDFTFTASFANQDVTVTPGGTFPLSDGYIWTNTSATVNTTNIPIAAAFPSLASITFGAGPFQKKTTGLLQSPSLANGWPTDGSSAYLGVEFYDTSNNLDQGWIQLSASVNSITFTTTPTQSAVNGFSAPPSFTINSFGVATPEPSSLALMALGAAGLGILRARRKRTQ